MMKTLTAWLILCCGLTGIACAQGQNPKSFTFTANSQCLIINTDPSSTSGVYIDVSGTFSLTLQPAASVSGSTYKNVAVVPTTSQSQQATITAVGGYNAAVAGPDHFEVCTTGYVSGSAVVTLSPTTGVASNTLGGGGGGSGTVTNIATTSPVTGGPITGTGTIAISGVTAEQGNGAKLQLSTGTTTLNDCVKFDANGNTVDAGAACGSGGGANAALSNLSAVSINTSLLAQTGADLGGTSNPFHNLYIFGAGTYGSTYFKFTGTPTSTRTWTIQDATDTLVGRATTDTLTNKSIAGSEVNSGTVPVAQIPTAIPIGSVGSAGLSGTLPIGITSAGVISTTSIAGFRFGNAGAADTVGTAAQAATLIQGLTGCNTATYVFTPQASDCVAPSAASLSFPLTVSGTTTSGGIPYFSGTTTLTSSGILNTNILVKGGGAGGAPTNSLFSDNGTTATYSGTGGITASAGPIISGTPAGGVGSSFELLQEGLIPTGLSTSGQDDCYADSTQHGILCNFNAGTTLPLVQGPASATSGHIATWSGTNGGRLVDGGAAAAGTVTSVAQSVPTGFAIGGSPVTTSGTLAITTSGLTTNHLQKAVSGGIADSTVLDNATTVSTTEPFVSSTYDTCPDTSASGTAQVCNTTPTFTVVTGSCVVYTTTTANTGTGLTLNVNSLGAKSVAKWQGSTTLAANDVLANKEVLACYDGTNWELGTIGNAPGGTVTSVATTAPITGGTFTTSGTIACATCVVASSPGAGIAHFAGSTQTVTSSAIVAADITNNTITGTQLASSLSLVTPLLGTPTSGVLTNETGYLENNLTGASAAGTITEGAATASVTRAGVATANLTAPWVIQNTNSSNNNNSITLGVSAPGTSTGQTVLNVNGAATGGDLADFGTGGTWTAGVLSGQTIVAAIGPTGTINLGGGTIPTVGTAGGSSATEGTAFTGTSTVYGWYNDSTLHCFDIIDQTTNIGCGVGEPAILSANVLPKAVGTTAKLSASSISDNAVKVSTSEFLTTGNTQRLTADATPITATTPGTIVFTWGALPVSTNLSFTCKIIYNQQTAAVAGDGIAVQGATNAPTRLDAWGKIDVTDPASTNYTGSAGSALNITSTTATSVVTATPGAVTTVYQAEVSGSIQVGASASTLNILMFTGNVSDSITPKAGSFCMLTP